MHLFRCQHEKGYCFFPRIKSLQTLPVLEKEYNFWMLQRAQTFHDEAHDRNILFFQYRASMKTPRPESYREDLELAKDLPSDGLCTQNYHFSTCFMKKTYHFKIMFFQPARGISYYTCADSSRGESKSTAGLWLCFQIC